MTSLHHGMKLGKKPVRHDRRTLRLASYLERLPPPPAEVDWAKKADAVWGMMQNDLYGDCTCAAAAHAIQAWTANDSDREVHLTNEQVLAAYAAVTGFKPEDPSTDNGAVELDVLNYWRQTGIGGHKIGAYAALEPRNQDHVKIAIHLFGGCYIGLELPESAQDETVWSLPPYGAIWHPTCPSGLAGSWGGHAVYCVGYDQYNVVCVTWGAIKKMTWAFWMAYCEEAYAVLSPDWLGPDFMAPSGFNHEQLKKDLERVGRLAA